MKLIDAVNKAKALKLPWLTIGDDGSMYAFKYKPKNDLRDAKEWHLLGVNDWDYSEDEVEELDWHEYEVRDWTKCIVDVRTLKLKGKVSCDTCKFNHEEYVDICCAPCFECNEWEPK